MKFQYYIGTGHIAIYFCSSFMILVFRLTLFVVIFIIIVVLEGTFSRAEMEFYTKCIVLLEGHSGISHFYA